METLVGLLETVLARVRPDRARELRLSLRWPAVAGPYLAARTRVSLRAGVLRIEVGDERLAGQVRALIGELRARLDAAVGGVHEVQVSVVAMAPLARPQEPPPAAARPAPEVPAGVGAALAGIADADLRERTRAVAARYLAGAGARGARVLARPATGRGDGLGR